MFSIEIVTLPAQKTWNSLRDNKESKTRTCIRGRARKVGVLGFWNKVQNTQRNLRGETYLKHVCARNRPPRKEATRRAPDEFFFYPACQNWPIRTGRFTKWNKTGFSLTPAGYGITGDLTQPRRQRQRKRHLKIQVRVTCTTLCLFHFVQLLQCGRTIQ